MPRVHTCRVHTSFEIKNKGVACALVSWVTSSTWDSTCLRDVIRPCKLTSQPALATGQHGI